MKSFVGLCVLVLCAAAGAQEKTACGGRVKATSWVQQSPKAGRAYVEYGVTVTNSGVGDWVSVGFRESGNPGNPPSTVTRPNPHTSMMEKGTTQRIVLMMTQFPGAAATGKFTAAQILERVSLSCRLGSGTGDGTANW